MAVTRGQHLIGKVLGSCVLESLLGYGGSSAVFLARQSLPERKVAVKVFLPRSTMDRRMQRDFYRRFLREAEAASKLDHPNILPIYSYGEQEGLPYIIMPYMPGGTLTQYMAKRGPLSLMEALWYLEQLTFALDYAHYHGCIHCDVKPANILLDSEGHVILSDFGIARLTQTETDPERTEAKSPEAVMGTPDYISPEQALGRKLDGRSDIYSLAVTLFFLLSKRLPFRADSPIALALLHVHESPPSLALMRADITPTVDHVIQKALAKEPDQRFQSAGEFCTAFAEAIAASKKKLPLSRSKAGDGPNGDREEPFTGPEPVTVVTRPVGRRYQLWWRNVSTMRLLVSCIILLALIGAVSLAAIWLTPHSNHTPAKSVRKTMVTPTAGYVASIDLLANTDSWPASSTFFFDKQKRSYHILNNSADSVSLASYDGHQFSNFRLSVTMSEVHTSSDGSDYFGVVFRAAADESSYYLFEIAPMQNTQYAFQRYNGKWTSIMAGSSPSLLAGQGKSNILTIDARGNIFTFLINGKPVVTAATDPEPLPLKSGQIGLYVENQGTEVAFSHLDLTTP